MSLFAILLSFGFVILALFLSQAFKLGLGRDLIITSIRATIQLFIVGYILKMVFGFDNPFAVILMLLIMIIVAAENAAKRGKGLPYIFWKIFLTISFVEIITQGFLLGLQIVPATPQYIISISGMIIGSSMVIANLFLNRLKGELEMRKEEVLLVLSLGGSIKQSIYPILKQSIRSSLIPTIEGQKTIGLVQLPGMMTGQIIAGADPIQAVRFQLLIVFMILSAASLTAIILGFLIYPGLFNRHQQLDIQAWK
ncbi:iron export ABC transporter permease subunit FetB [Peribacillus cavernae]|uniref:Iron export ABC transporter permease subunit FetB n=1 Tax=Peribacillus cavernae TaxID=1674310 RepID=A0A433HKF6_9BACI|nr:iron export ABC transporter permease subunit FetB [Peribacillus cavernae]MDQ0220194.1 putative ABC transport system permease protein [Peribacillus cavernae]RUQ28818.1 iron export ABC transporter permease subunit FetB [Peribacillus cavernae]